MQRYRELTHDREREIRHVRRSELGANRRNVIARSAGPPRINARSLTPRVESVGEERSEKRVKEKKIQETERKTVDVPKRGGAVEKGGRGHEIPRGGSSGPSGKRRTPPRYRTCVTYTPTTSLRDLSSRAHTHARTRARTRGGGGDGRGETTSSGRLSLLLLTVNS